MSKKGGVVILPELPERPKLPETPKLPKLPKLPETPKLPELSETPKLSKLPESLLQKRDQNTPLPPIPTFSDDAAESSELLSGNRNYYTPLPPIPTFSDDAAESSELLSGNRNYYTPLKEEVGSLESDSKKLILEYEQKIEELEKSILQNRINITLYQYEYRKVLTPEQRSDKITILTDNIQSLQRFLEPIKKKKAIEDKYLEELNKIDIDIASLLENPSIKGEKHNIEERLRALNSNTEREYADLYETMRKHN